MIYLNKAQRKALAKLHHRMVQDWAQRDPSNAENMHAAPTYLQTRRSVQPYIGNDCVLVPVPGVGWVGIERDGYTHS